jgi:ATP-dependent DNA helicase DinG
MKELTVKALEASIQAIGGAPRSGQIEMANAISDAIENNKHLLVQAGTGTGKSYAYLIPALAHGGKVLVATATLALQRQLVERDLPKIHDTLEKTLGRDISFAIYKGVGNYLCRQKMGSENAPLDLDEIEGISSLEKEAKKLLDWASKPSSSGDRDDAPDVDRRVWSAYSVSGRECMGRDECPFGASCFSGLAKDKAMVADVVITNHTLLAIEIVENHPILPERDLVILDEAHEFLDRTTQAVTEELTAHRVDRAVKMAKKYSPGKASDAFAKASDAFADAIDSYSEDIRTSQGNNGKLDELPAVFEKPIRAIKESATALISLINADNEALGDDDGAERAQVKGAVQEVLTTATKILRNTSDQVLWFEPTFSTLYLAPLNVSPVLAENMLSKTPVIATSATLTVGGKFDAIARSLGMSDDYTALDVGSPFDYASQGILYLPKHLPEPTRDGISIEALTELGELIEAAGGRTLALFSSWRGVEAAELHLKKVLAELPIPILVQRKGDAISSLVNRFSQMHSSVLIGTISLWQGIDVPGSSCTLVSIDRIPFPRPDEPVMAARAALADEAGGSGFRDVSLPRAALLLAQGTGRLIRTTSDRGVVAILDSRIVNKSYGKTLLNSMPPFWRTSDGATVKESLRNLDAGYKKVGE